MIMVDSYHKARPRSSMDRIPACGACDRGSNPLEGTYEFLN